MNTIGRNDPCPCGSGKKYKKCCGATIERSPEFVYDRIRRLDRESTYLLMRFAKQRFGEDALEDAWLQYRFYHETPFDMSGPESDSFLWWFLFNWKPEEKETLAELFLSEMGSKLDQDLRRFIEATLHAPYSFFQTLEVDPGAGLTLRDILRRRNFNVQERSASTMLERGHILFARLVELDNVCFFMGISSYIIPPRYLEWVLNIRSFLESKEEISGGSLASESLLRYEEDLREIYFEMEDALKNTRVEIRNTDGDPLEFHTLTYEIPSFEIAFQALKDLEQKITKITDSELMAEAETNQSGQPEKLVIRWLRRGYKGGFGDNTTLATLTIGASTLVVEVNSEKRSKRIQKEIKKRLGDNAVLLRTEIRSHDDIMREIEEHKEDGEPPEESEHDRIMRESPEARELMRGMMEKHWARWPDIPLPALRGMTPRQAAKDPEGRELLESLLMEFELHNRTKRDEFLRVDTAKLRRVLGLEEG